MSDSMIISHYKGQISAIKVQIEGLQTKLESLESIVKEMEQIVDPSKAETTSLANSKPSPQINGLFETSDTSGESTDYPFTGTSPQKVLWLIKKANRFVNSIQIQDMAEQYEKDLSKRWASNHVNRAFKKKWVTRIRIEDSHNKVFYGLSDWVTEENGLVKFASPSHRPTGDRAEVKNKRDIKLEVE